MSAARPNEFVVRASTREVESWSVARLPFEPKGWQLVRREELRAALRDLSTSGTTFVEARHDSAGSEMCDVENVLIYNVRPAALAPATRDGVRFERRFNAPPSAPNELGATHYYRYRASRATGEFDAWRSVTTLARFQDVELPLLRSSSNPADIWLPLRTAPTRQFACLSPEGYFSVRIQLKVPPSAPSAAALIKPLLDGAISAFQADHDDSQHVEVARWMSERLAMTGKLPRLFLVIGLQQCSEHVDSSTVEPQAFNGHPMTTDVLQARSASRVPNTYARSWQAGRLTRYQK